MPDPIIGYKTITIVQKKTLSNGSVRSYPAKKTYPLTGYARSDGTRKEKVAFTELQKADIRTRAAAGVRINRLQTDYNCTWAAINKVLKEGEYLTASAGATIPLAALDMGEVCIDVSTKPAVKEQSTPTLVTDNLPLVTDNLPLVTDNLPLVTDNLPLVTNTPTLVDNPPSGSAGNTPPSTYIDQFSANASTTSTR